MDFSTDTDKAKFLQKQLESLIQIRQPYEAMVDNVIKFVNHGRRKIGDDDSKGGKGKKTGDEVFDGTALSAANLAADGIHGYMCSPSIHWFDLTLPNKLNFPRTSGMRSWSGKRTDEYPEVRVWLDECEEVLYPAFRRSNFYDFHPDFTKEGITIGTGTAIVEEDIKTGSIIFTLPHFRECYIAENQFGKVDTLYRKYKLTLRQLVQKFGQDKIFELNQSFRQQYEKDPYADKEIIHATFPRSDYDPSKLDGKNKPFASFWLLSEGSKKKLIEESGYWDLPTVTWRWRKNSDELYGRSPAWDAYVDICKGNAQAQTNLVAGHKMVDPPMQAPSDLRGRVNSNPGGWTWIDGAVTKDRVAMPMMQGIQLPYGIDQQERTDKSIREHFHVDFFLMLNQAAFNKVPLTATQVVGMQGEQAAVLGTRIGRHQSEGLNPLMDRAWNIEERAGRLPQPPQILLDLGGGQNIEIDYLGPLSQAQKLTGIQSIRAGIEIAREFATTPGMEMALDMIDADKTITEMLNVVGFPAKCLREKASVDEVRGLRQKKQEAAENLEAMGELAKAGQRLTRKVEKGSGIDMMTGGGMVQE